MRSPFASRFTASINKLLVGGRARAIDVALSNGTNHFAPNDFAPAFYHSKTNCSLTRRPPENAFQTTAARQADVVRSIADVVAVSYYSYRYGGDAVVPSIKEMLPKIQYVRSAEVFSNIPA